MAVIALDLDGTLARPKWPGIGDPYPGAVEGVKALQAAGHVVYIFTARVSEWRGEGIDRRQVEQVHNWLADNGLAGLRVVPKPHYDVLVDDKALRHPPREHAWRHTPARIAAALVHDKEAP